MNTHERRDSLLVHGTFMEQAEKAENEWQSPAAIYTLFQSALGMSAFQRVEGERLSYNNWCDLDGALQHITHIAVGFKRNFGHVPCIAVGVKHGSACGAAVSFGPDDALRAMIEGAPEALHGGCVITNFPLSDYGAVMLREHCAKGERRILDLVAAPSFGAWAKNILARPRGRCRMLENPALARDPAALDTAPRFRFLRDAMLVQANYTSVLDIWHKEWNVDGRMTLDAWQDIVFAWAIGSTSRSNTITLVKNGMLLANAVGQQKRAISARLAVMIASEAGHTCGGAVAYSDSFFPFIDASKVLIDAGVKAIFATRGSIHDVKVREYIVSRGVTFATLPDTHARGFFGH